MKKLALAVLVSSLVVAAEAPGVLQTETFDAGEEWSLTVSFAQGAAVTVSWVKGKSMKLVDSFIYRSGEIVVRQYGIIPTKVSRIIVRVDPYLNNQAVVRIDQGFQIIEDSLEVNADTELVYEVLAP